eukprot:GEMP01017241.1.p1 GENE.GEMP01017241.1~~GEMP01017241.1.p1  ORF type:complete len:828 (+),score=178.83 GEMP01017241.1:43-2484(+)
MASEDEYSEAGGEQADACSKVAHTNIIKNEDAKPLQILQALSCNFGLLFHQLPAEAFGLLGVACDSYPEAFPGCVVDEEFNHHANAETYARVDGVGLSSTSTHVLTRFHDLPMLIPDGVTMDDMAEEPLLVRRRYDNSLEELASTETPPFTVYYRVAKLRLPEEDASLFDKEALYPHSHYVQEVIVGAKIDIGEGGPVDTSAITEQLRQSRVEQWEILWCHMRGRYDVKAKFFEKKVSGPTCERGHPMFRIMFKDVAWNKVVLCKTCRKPTSFALETCKRRCELSGICQQCEVDIAQAMLCSHLEEQKASEQRLKRCTRQESPPGVPRFQLDEPNIFFRTRLHCNISEEEYNDDPFEFDGKIIGEISSILQVDPKQIAVIDVLQGLVLEIAFLHPSVDVEATRHYRRVASASHPTPTYVEMSLASMFDKVRGVIESQRATPLDPEIYPMLSRAISMEEFTSGSGDIIVSAPNTDFKGMLVPNKNLCEVRTLTCQVCNNATMLDCNIKRHMTHDCNRRVVACDLRCGLNLLYEDLTKHLYNSCPERGVLCKCKKVLTAKDLEPHLMECEQRSWTCPKCSVETICARRTKHELEECDFRQVSCSWCKVDLRWNNVTTHKNLSCPKRTYMAIALKEASWKLKHDLVATLLVDGANPNTYCPVATGKNLPDDSALGNCLHVIAVVQAPYDFAQLLLEHLADANLRDGSGLQPLHVAAQHGAVEVCQALVDYKADVQGEDNEGRTPLFLAGFHQHRECIAVLETAGGHQVMTTPRHIRRGTIQCRDLEAMDRITAYKDRIQPIRDAFELPDLYVYENA